MCLSVSGSRYYAISAIHFALSPRLAWLGMGLGSHLRAQSSHLSIGPTALSLITVLAPGWGCLLRPTSCPAPVTPNSCPLYTIDFPGRRQLSTRARRIRVSYGTLCGFRWLYWWRGRPGSVSLGTVEACVLDHGTSCSSCYAVLSSLPASAFLKAAPRPRESRDAFSASDRFRAAVKPANLLFPDAGLTSAACWWWIRARISSMGPAFGIGDIRPGLIATHRFSSLSLLG